MIIIQVHGHNAESLSNSGKP